MKMFGLTAETKCMVLPIWEEKTSSLPEDYFSDIVNKYTHDIYNFSRWMLGDPTEAEDITSETFLSLYNNLKKLDLQQPIKPWLIKVAKNKCLDFIKKKKNLSFTQLEEEVFEVPDGEPGLEAKFDSQEFLDQVKKLIDLFQPEVKAVLLLKYFEELTFHEIAQVLEISENTAKSHFYRAQSTLYKRIKETLYV